MSSLFESTIVSKQYNQVSIFEKLNGLNPCFTLVWLIPPDKSD
ncbi:conserved hypothetical protein [Marinoscillum sp. 108]|nr:conserved hypothetical protein [Marinoscillum sp. 108]